MQAPSPEETTPKGWGQQSPSKPGALDLFQACSAAQDSSVPLYPQPPASPLPFSGEAKPKGDFTPLEPK